MSPQTEFGPGGVISSAAVSFPSHRLFTLMYFIASFECQVSFPVKTRSTGSERFAFLGRGFV